MLNVSSHFIYSVPAPDLAVCICSKAVFELVQPVPVLWKKYERLDLILPYILDFNFMRLNI